MKFLPQDAHTLAIAEAIVNKRPFTALADSRDNKFASPITINA